MPTCICARKIFAQVRLSSDDFIFISLVALVCLSMAICLAINYVTWNQTCKHVVKKSWIYLQFWLKDLVGAVSLTTVRTLWMPVRMRHYRQIQLIFRTWTAAGNVTVYRFTFQWACICNCCIQSSKTAKVCAKSPNFCVHEKLSRIIISHGVCHSSDRYHSDMYKCLYDVLKNNCNATASAVYTNYRVTVWKRWLATRHCYISEWFWNVVKIVANVEISRLVTMDRLY